MRITSKGQVTIPVEIRVKAGFLCSKRAARVRDAPWARLEVPVELRDHVHIPLQGLRRA